MATTNSGRKQPTAVSRMKLDYMRLKRDPLPYIYAEPMPNNILEWHYCVKGPENSPYYGGYYHGTLLFPREFPFKPPSIYMLTPNGRFKTNTRLCLSISDFHPDTWNPTWCVGTILTGLLSFMLETTPTLGSVETSYVEKQIFAKRSLAFNLQNQQFCELFPEIVQEIKKRLQMQQQQVGINGIGVTNGNRKKSDNNSKHGVANGGPHTLNGQISGDSDDNVVGQSLNADSGNTVVFHSSRNSYVNWQSVCSNVVIIICFVIFALIVNYVIKNLNQE